MVEFKCPGNDPVTRAVPVLLSCPRCGKEVEIWTDEIKSKCPVCKEIVYRNNSEAEMDDLVSFALKSGATGARRISTSDISVEDDLAELCHDPRCENLGLSANCPPHTTGPSGFRELLNNYQNAVFFKIDVPAASLMSDHRREIFRFLQETAAAVEKAAVEKGYENAKSFAGGSCKKLFCENHRKCNVLDGRECRNPDHARPSMSGFGINVSKLMDLCGWKLEWQTGGNGEGMGSVCGLVLAG